MRLVENNHQALLRSCSHRALVQGGHRQLPPKRSNATTGNLHYGWRFTRRRTCTAHPMTTSRSSRNATTKKIATKAPTSKTRTRNCNKYSIVVTSTTHGGSACHYRY